MSNNTIASTMTVRAMQGDTLDAICWRIYGEQMLQSAIVEQVLELNPGLADLGAVLPMGRNVVLPVLATQNSPGNRKEVVQLWT